MGYKNFSEICPIFNTDNESGLEHELTPPIMISNTVTAYPVFTWTPGREVVVTEADLVVYNSDGLTTGISCSLQIASDGSCSTAIGSVACGCAELSDNPAYFGVANLPFSFTSTALTSTDVLSVWMVQGAGGSTAGANSLTIRYREK